MKRIMLGLMVSLVAGNYVHSEKLDVVERRYNKIKEKIQKKYDTEIGAVNRKMIADYNKLIKKYSKEGNLDLVESYTKKVNILTGEIIIEEANYGSEHKTIDVKSRIKRKIKDNKIYLKITNNSMGKDPHPGPKKKLHLVYMHHGERIRVSVEEEDFLKIGN